MATGYPSPIAPWVGGAQAPASSGGPQASLWMGAPNPVKAGPRGMLGFWMGGISAAHTHAGFRGMTVFWAGGASAGGGGAPAWRRIAAQRVLSGVLEDDDECIMLLYS